MAAKYRIALTGCQIQTDPIQEKLDLVAGIFNLVSVLNKQFGPAKLIFVHGCYTAFDLWAGTAIMNLGLPLEIQLPFPRIKTIVHYKLKPIQAEALNLQIEYADNVYISHKTVHDIAYLKRTKTLINRCSIAVTYGMENTNSLFIKYCRSMFQPILDLKKFYAITDYNNIHTMEEL